MAHTLDKFSKADLFKLFGKARKENRALKQTHSTLCAQTTQLTRALSAANERVQVLQLSAKHVHTEFAALKVRAREELQIAQTAHEEQIGLIKTQSASYMDEVNRLSAKVLSFVVCRRSKSKRCAVDSVGGAFAERVGGVACTE